MVSEEFSDAAGILCVAVHTDRKGFYPSQNQETVHRSRDCTNGILEKGNLISERWIIHDHCATDHIRVSSEVLGCRVQYDVGAHFQRLLEVRGCEGVVHNDPRLLPTFLSFASNPPDVHDPE